MQSSALGKRRSESQQRRRAPQEPLRIDLAFSGDGLIPTDAPPGPVALALETTDSAGELAAWLDDEWWADAIQLWGDRDVTIHVAPTPEALLHPVSLYFFEMVRRVIDNWRLVAYAYVEDFAEDEEMKRLAGALYHEVRFIDGPRPGVPRSDRFTGDLSLETLFGRIRKEQARQGRGMPVLVRLPSSHVGPTFSSKAPPPARLSEAAKPTVDRH